MDKMMSFNGMMGRIEVVVVDGRPYGAFRPHGGTSLWTPHGMGCSSVEELAQEVRRDRRERWLAAQEARRRVLKAQATKRAARPRTSLEVADRATIKKYLVA